jgi:prepilin-type N-terminal cleavage/methylation domain-containing protein
MRRGTSLLELLAVLAVLGVLSLIGLPPLRAAADRLAVDGAARAIVAAHTRARLLAVTEHRVMLLSLSSEQLVLRARRSAVDTVERWHHTGPGADGVGADGLPHQVLVAPSGITFGLANHTYTLTRGAARRQVVVSRYGRVQLR